MSILPREYTPEQGGKNESRVATVSLHALQASTRPSRKDKAILKACESERSKCTWMAGIYGELPAI